jgi:hypothetical protein
MAEEKKKPDLKARLNRTAAGAAPPAAPTAPGSADVGAASPDFVPAPAPAVGAEDDLVVPDFIKQQMAEKAAAEARAAEEARRAAEEARRAAEARAAEEEARKRRAAMAADPFAAGGAVHEAPQEIRIVMDDKVVEDHEVGRKRTGSVVAILVAAAVSLGVGFLGGNWLSDRDQANRTRAAVTEIRTHVDEAGALISTMKEKIDRAAEAAAIPAARGEEPAAPAAAPAAARLDEDLTTWFAQLSPEPPLTPDHYAGRVGRLRPDLLQKLMKVQIQLQEAWFQLRRHQEITQGTLPIIRGALQQLQPARADLSRLMVVFEPGTGNGPPVMGTLTFARPGAPNGAFTLEPAPAGAPPTRTLYTSGDIAAPAIIRTVGVPVAFAQGVPPHIVGGVGRAWIDYQARLRSLRTLVDQLANDHRQLADALNH